MQHSVPVAHVVPVSLHGESGAAQAPFSHRFVQHSAFCLQPAPSALHTMVQTLAAHFPKQHSGSDPHAVLRPLHVAVGSEHRGGSYVLSQKPAQQSPVPPAHASPGGRHVGSVGSASHLSLLQTLEQHSALVAQAAPRTMHSPPHAPPKHPREQQSAARVHGTPSAAHAAAHVLPPFTSLTQRPVQHAEASVHGAPVGAHVAAPKQIPWSQRPEQQSMPVVHVPPPAVQSDGRHVPPLQAAEQHRPASVQAAPEPWQLRGAHVPFSQAFEQHAAATAHAPPFGWHESAAAHVPPEHTLEQQSTGV